MRSCLALGLVLAALTAGQRVQAGEAVRFVEGAGEAGLDPRPVVRGGRFGLPRGLLDGRAAVLRVTGHDAYPLAWRVNILIQHGISRQQ